jgi:hypothetical protein
MTGNHFPERGSQQQLEEKKTANKGRPKTEEIDW